MKEAKRIIRIFILTMVWIIFAVCTLCGLITAKEQTARIYEGKEPRTVQYSFIG